MSVLIKGMEMPNGCNDCKLMHRHQGAYCVDYCYPLHTTVDPWTFGRERNGDKPDWCPLLPLPEGHGRLIDADALLARDDGYYTQFGYYPDDIREAPTIVPAEGGTENG